MILLIKYNIYLEILPKIIDVKIKILPKCPVYANRAVGLDLTPKEKTGD